MHMKQHQWPSVLLLFLGIAIGFWVPSLYTRAEEVAVPEFTGRPPTEHPMLTPCSRYEDRYDQLLFAHRNIKEWPEIYHDQMRRVVDEYLEPTTFKCDAENYTEFMKPGKELLSLAAALPTWNDPKVPLSRFDISRVLLEYLRIYECSLMEYDTFLYFDTTKEKFDEQEIVEGKPVNFFDFFFSDLLDEASVRADLVNTERTIARKTLQRVLTLIATAERLRPLEAELECMQRYSLDVRNAMSLTAEASSCLPRIWNAKDILRDINDEQ